MLNCRKLKRKNVQSKAEVIPKSLQASLLHIPLFFVRYDLHYFRVVGAV